MTADHYQGRHGKWPNPSIALFERTTHRQLVDLAKHPEPWTLPTNRPQSSQGILWFVYLGLLDLHATMASLLERFPDEQADERNYVKGQAPLAVIVVDADGRPIPGKTFLASYPWGYGQVLGRRVAEPCSVFVRRAGLARSHRERALRVHRRGNIQPVTPEGLRSLTRWLVQELNVPEDQVEPDGIAIRIIQSGSTSEPPEPELLSSFYLPDLDRVRDAVKRQNIGAALSRYMDITPPVGSRDIVKDHALLQETLNPARIPLTRWPDRRSLSRMQQAAVNHAVADLRVNGIAGINGPPGTGKTTFLRDIGPDFTRSLHTSMEYLPTHASGSTRSPSSARSA